MRVSVGGLPLLEGVQVVWRLRVGEQCGELGWAQAGGTVVAQRFLRCGVENITGVLSSRLPVWWGRCLVGGLDFLICLLIFRTPALPANISFTI